MSHTDTLAWISVALVVLALIECWKAALKTSLTQATPYAATAIVLMSVAMVLSVLG